MSDQAPEPIEISFAAAYDRLKEITERLNGEEVEVDELVELLREAKGLEVVLRDYLTQIEQEVTAIEKGEGIASYRVVGAEAPQPDLENDLDDAADVQDADAAPEANSDDIPF